MNAVRTRALVATTVVIAVFLVGSRWFLPVRADEPGGPTLLGKYVRVTFTPTGRDGVITDVLGTAKAVEAAGIHVESEVFIYQNADNANELHTIFVPWNGILFVTVMPPKTSKD